jgi:hypothetical protein
MLAQEREVKNVYAHEIGWRVRNRNVLVRKKSK